MELSELLRHLGKDVTKLPWWITVGCLNRIAKTTTVKEDETLTVSIQETRGMFIKLIVVTMNELGQTRSFRDFDLRLLHSMSSQ